MLPPSGRSICRTNGEASSPRRFSNCFNLTHGSSTNSESTATTVGDSLKRWLSFMLLYNYVIPISLYVTMELQKLAGAWLINWDLEVRVVEKELERSCLFFYLANLLARASSTTRSPTSPLKQEPPVCPFLLTPLSFNATCGFLHVE